MALLGARYCVFFNQDVELLHDLCRSNLASVYAIDRTAPNKQMMIVGYPSEPVVALASAMLSYTVSACKPVALISELNRQIKKGAVEAGYRGEVAARFLLLLARDAAVFLTPKEDKEAELNIKYNG